jgi:uncharacterized protein (DUF2141 family)
MKKVFLYFGVFFFILSNLLTAQNNPNKQKTGNLTIIVSALQNNKGNVRIGLFNSKESYSEKEQLFKGAKIKVENKKVKWHVNNIPFGEYAIKAFHDEDSNDKIDTNFFGIPTESYGFSNNAKALFGPPSFDKAKFTFNKQDMQIEIKF